MHECFGHPSFFVCQGVHLPDERRDLEPGHLRHSFPKAGPAQGVTLSRVLDDPSHRVRDLVFVERSNYPTLRTENALLAWHCQGQAQGELYDLEADPNCLRNRWGKPEATSLQRKMTNLLIRAMAENVDPLQILHGRC